MHLDFAQLIADLTEVFQALTKDPKVVSMTL